MGRRRLARFVPLCLLLASACRRESTTTPPEPAATPAAEAGLPDRDPALAHRLVEQEGGVLLDVRTPEEFAEGHVEGAHNVPHDQISARIDEIEQLTGGEADTPIVVYCKSGARAGTAKQTLLEHGYSRVTNVGGMSDW